MDTDFTSRFQYIRWILIRLPATVILILVGFIFDFVTTLPFMVCCALDRRMLRK